MPHVHCLRTLAARLLILCAATGGWLPSTLAADAEPQADADGWFSIFNGKDLAGWKAAESPDSFKVVDGELVLHGPRGHLFYTGSVNGADFKNLDWKCEVMIKPHSNSGMYFHTEYQEEGWPGKGYEAQLNNSHPDPKKTGGLYGIVDVMDHSPVKDDEWFTQQVTVEGKHIIIRVNGKITADYAEPDGVERPADFAGRLLSHGTIALQAHDPESEVHIRKIMIKPLP